MIGIVGIAREMYVSYRETVSEEITQSLLNEWDELGDTIQGAWIAAAGTAYNLSVGTE